MPKALDLPVEPITGRPRFVTERQPFVFGGQLSHQLGGGRRRVVELAQKPNLVAPTAIRDCNRITQLCGIESHESFAMIVHDSPSLFEALPNIRATLALTSRVSRLSKGRGIRSEMLRASIFPSGSGRISGHWAHVPFVLSAFPEYHPHYDGQPGFQCRRSSGVFTRPGTFTAGLC